MRQPRAAASALLVCLALGACAKDGAAPSPPRPEGSSVTSSAPADPGTPGTGGPGTPAPAPAPSRSKNLPGTPGTSGPAGTTTLTGLVTAGVEPGCLLLGDHLLLGGPREVLRPGARVSVTGRVQADLVTTCQQGTPFVVDTARPA